MAKNVIIPKLPAKALERARDSIEGAKERWASSTMEGFMRKWNEWYANFVVPELIRIRLPPKSSNIRDNVVNRVVPVAEAVSRASARYRMQRQTEVVPLAPVAPA